MSKLAFKTKLNTSTENKAKVYLACHPKDFGRYFNAVSKIILDLKDCVIWYDESNYETFDMTERSAELEEMQVVAILITKNLFSDKNAILDYEKIIVENRSIAFLPLAVESMEGILLEEYKKHFGNLQYFELYPNSKTTIKMEEKLENYLNEVLIDARLFEQIKDSFDANIFISYRKIDRQYAKELMEIIHRNEKFHGLGFWYDEFLIPGEDFGESINQKLLDCSFVLLCVTPNVLEDGNFIIEDEYPFARETAQKEIIPIEMIKTSRGDLEERYIEIREVLSIEDVVSLYLRIEETLQQAGVENKELTPELLYYRGMGYLNGIGVEKNEKIGIKYLEKAAQKECKEAIKQLAHVYEVGKGVPIDLEMCKSWKEKYVRLLEKNIANKVEESYEELFLGLKELGELCQALDKDVEAQETFNEMLTLSHMRIIDTYADPEWVFKKVISYRMLGDLAYKLDLLEEADALLEEGLQLVTKIQFASVSDEEIKNGIHSNSKEGGIYESNLEKAAIYELQGRIAEEKQDYDTMFSCYGLCRDMRWKLDEIYSTVESKEKLAHACANCVEGYMLRSHGMKINRVEHNAERGVQLYKELLDDTGKIMYLLDLTDLLLKQAKCYFSVGDWTRVYTTTNELILWHFGYDNRWDIPEFMERLELIEVNAYELQGNALVNRGRETRNIEDIKAALQSMEYALGKAERMYINGKIYKEQLITRYDTVAQLNDEVGRYNEAQKHRRKVEYLLSLEV